MKQETKDKIIGLLLGITLGAGVTALIGAYYYPTCPICDSYVKRGDSECWQCHSRFKWGRLFKKTEAWFT